VSGSNSKKKTGSRGRGSGATGADEITRFQRFAQSAYDLGRYGAQQLIRDRAPQMAAALAYRTLFSLIPVLVLTLIILKAFVGPEGIREGMNQLMGYLALDEIAVETAVDPDSAPEEEPDPNEPPPPDDQAITFDEYVSEFVDNAMDRVTGINYGAITIVGVGVLIWAALALLIQIEQAFNVIFRAPSGRKLFVRITNYWTLLTLGSIGVFASFAIGETYARFIERMPTWLDWAAHPLQLASRIGIAWLLLLFAYTRMPSTRVRLKPAAVGAIIGALLWELAKSGLTVFVRYATEGQVAVYGSLALIPIFLLWVYVTWLIVLFGLEVTHVLQTAHRAREAEPEGPVLIEPGAAVLLMREIARDFAAGRGAIFDDLVERTGVREDVASRIIDRLCAERLLHRVVSDADEDAFALARPAREIRIEDILDAAYDATNDPASAADAELLRSLRQRQLGVFADERLDVLLDGEAGSERWAS